MVWVEFLAGLAIGICLGIGAMSTMALLYKGD